MKRILFVDDESRVLDGLRRMLRGVRREWEMHFVESGEEALKLLDVEGESEFDVVISDMRMPGMDGAELLTAVQERHPRTVRIILSGHAELELAMRSTGCAHQFLTKPCDSEHIKSVVTRSLALHERLRDENLKSVVGKLNSLPALPTVYGRLTAAMADEDVTIEAVAEIVQGDAGIAAKVLQLVNSSFFGVGRRVENVRGAVSYLGLANLRTLVLNYGMLHEFDPESAAPSFDIEAEQEHSLQVATLAQFLQKGDKKASEEAFLAGILHDIGQLVIATNMPELFERVRRAARLRRVPCHTLEAQSTGVTHGDVGAYLLGIWGMSDAIVEAAQLHHDPGAVEVVGRLDTLGAVHVADALLMELAHPDHESSLNVEFVRGLGLEDELSRWRTLASEVFQGQSEAA